MHIDAFELPKFDRPGQHIEYVGAGAVGLGALGLADAVSKAARRWFTRGFTREEVPEELVRYLDDEPGLFIRCLRDEARLQLDIFSEDDIPKLVDRLGNAELRGPLTQLLVPAQCQATRSRLSSRTRCRKPQS